MDLPALPPSENGQAYSATVYEAYNHLRETFDRARHILDLQQMDPLRYQIHLDIINRDAIPLLEAIESQSARQAISQAWLKDVLDAFAQIVIHLTNAVRSGTVE